MNLTLTTAAGAVTTASAPLLGPGLLPVRYARNLAALQTDANADAAYDQDVKSCRRMSARRVDCRIDATEADVEKGCTFILSVQLPANGRLTFRSYHCGYKRRPRFAKPQLVPDSFLAQIERGAR